jgi:hypothetical protein
MEISESEYYVSWSEKITASSPAEAARKALAMQRDPEAPGSARAFAVHAGARELSIEVSASGATAHVRWDSAEQVGSDGMYTAEFWAMPPERQLQLRVSDYLSERLSIPEIPHPDGWEADDLDTEDNSVGFIVRTTGPSFKVTIESYSGSTPPPADATSG